MTYRDYVRDHFPLYVNDDVDGGILMCPPTYGFDRVPCSGLTCDACWGREISDSDKSHIEYGEIHEPTAKALKEALGR